MKSVLLSEVRPLRKGSNECERLTKDGVDAGELLEEHRDSSDDDAAEHCLGGEEGADGDKLELGNVLRGEIH